MVTSASTTQITEKAVYTLTHGSSTAKLVFFPQIGQMPAMHRQQWNDIKVEGLSRPNTYDGVNRDRIGMLVCENYMAAAIADGNLRDGALVADRIVKETLRKLFHHYQKIPNEAELKTALMIAWYNIVNDFSTTAWNGGTTLSVVVVSKNGEFRAAQVGDSPIYLIEKEIPDRLGSEETIFVGKTRERAKGLDYRTYFENDHQMTSCILIEDVVDKWVETTSGIIRKGDQILIVSDGLTKNMPVIVDPSGLITDSTRCLEIYEAVLRRERVGTLAGAFGRDLQRFSDPLLLSGRVLLKGIEAYRLAPDDKSGITLSHE